MSFSVTPLTIALLVLAVIMVAAPQFIRGTTSPHIQMMFAQHKFEELLAYLDTPLVRIGYPKWNRTFMKLNVYLVEGKTDDASLMLSELLSVHSSREQRKELILKAFDFYIGLERYEEAGALLPEITEITDEVTAKDRQATYDVLAKGNCGYVEEMEQDMLWVTTAYVLASTVAMPIYGKLGDLIGRRGLFLGALVLFAVGSVACALAAAMAGLIVGRAMQGLGGGGLMILSQAIVADVVPPRRRAWYLSIMLHAHVMHEGLESFARKRKHPMAGKADKTRTPDGTVHETISSRPTLGVGNLYHGPLRREALERSIDRRLAHTLLAIQKVVVNLIDRKRLASMNSTILPSSRKL